MLPGFEPVTHLKASIAVRLCAVSQGMTTSRPPSRKPERLVPRISWWPSVALVSFFFGLRGSLEFLVAPQMSGCQGRGVLAKLYDQRNKEAAWAFDLWHKAWVWLWVRTMYQHGTLANGTKDLNLRKVRLKA